MNQIRRAAALLLVGMSISAAEFQNGQAARAVIGAESFSAVDASLAPAALSISNGRLYVADASHRLLTFDLTQLPGPKDRLSATQSSVCTLCGFAPVASVTQSVFPGLAAVSTFGKTVVVADSGAHRVLIWRDSGSPRALKSPDLILGRVGDIAPVSGSTLVDPISVAYDGKRLFVGDAALHRVLIWNSLPASDTQPADAVLGQQSLTSMSAAESPGPETIARPAALISDGTNLYVADSTNHRILVFSPGDTPLANNALSNSASLASGPLAPGTLATITGRSLSDVSESMPEDSDEPLPKLLGGVQVSLDGLVLPLLSVSPNEVRVQIPYDLGDTSAASLYVRTAHSDGTVTVTNAIAMKLLAATPALFAFGGAEPRNAMVLHTDATTGQPSAPVTSDDPARAGEIVILWAAGLGDIDSDSESLFAGLPYSGPDAPVLVPVNAAVGGRSAQVVSATLPRGAIGVYEIRVQLPADLGFDPTVPLSISQEGQVSNTVLIPIERSVQ